MPDYVRVKVNGRKVTTSRSHATNAGLTIVDEPATDAFGRPLSETRDDGRQVKRRTTVDQAAAERTTKKTTARKRAAKKSTSTQEATS